MAVQEINKLENDNGTEVTFDEKVIKCQNDIFNILNKANLPASVIILMLEKITLMAEKSTQVGK